MHDLLREELGNPFTKLLPETIDYTPLRMPTPKDLHRGYRSGELCGVFAPTSSGPYGPWARYQQDLISANRDQPLVLEDAPVYDKIRGAGKGKRVLQGKDWLALDPTKAGFGNQLTGDCVSWATRLALDLMRCGRILSGKYWEIYYRRSATAPLYAGRRHNGQGAVSSWITAYACDVVGTVLEQVYEVNGKTYDFRDYATYVKWGMSHGVSGVPKDLAALTYPHRPGGWHLVKTPEAAMDVMASGGTLHVGSQLAVEDVGGPISRRSGTWAHDMGIVMYDDTQEFHAECVWGFDQSWGKWNRVTNIPTAWLPILEGQFFVTSTTLKYAINTGELCALIPGKFYEMEDLYQAL